MKIRYNITKEKCPFCGTILKEENGLKTVLLLLISFGVSFFMIIGYSVIHDRILGDPTVPKIVSSHKKCPHCSAVVRMKNHYTWGELNALQKLNYQFRWWFRLSYFIGGITMMMLLCFLLSMDVVFIPVMLACAGIVAVIVVFYKRKLKALQN